MRVKAWLQVRDGHRIAQKTVKTFRTKRYFRPDIGCSGAGPRTDATGLARQRGLNSKNAKIIKRTTNVR